jgi:hypothetical protein
MVKTLTIYDVVIVFFIFFKMAGLPPFSGMSYVWLAVPILINFLHHLYIFFMVATGRQHNFMAKLMQKAYVWYVKNKMDRLRKKFVHEDRKNK